jgi:secreted Zn-dependent insulinase-like peptidase
MPHSLIGSLTQPPVACPAGLRLWHKLAAAYQQPRVCAYFRLAGPAAAASPAAAVLGALWMRLVEEALAEDAYLAGGQSRVRL